MNAERLLRLADHLDTVPAVVFDMTQWAMRADCGTVACALGHACSIPEFAAAGLRLDWSHGPYERPSESACVRLGDGSPLNGYGVAGAFFDLYIQDVYHLFSPSDYLDANGDQRADIHPAEVAARIRDLVAKGTVPE